MAREAITTTLEPKGAPADRQAIEDQIEFNKTAEGENQQPDNAGRLKAEQEINEFPDFAEIKRGYAKWTDNDGNFRKFPIDGTTAVREPAHEQHDLDIENANHVELAFAQMTPRRANDKALRALHELHQENIMNDQVHADLAKDGVTPAEPSEELAGVTVVGDRTRAEPSKERDQAKAEGPQTKPLDLSDTKRLKPENG